MESASVCVVDGGCVFVVCGVYALVVVVLFAISWECASVCAVKWYEAALLLVPHSLLLSTYYNLAYDHPVQPYLRYKCYYGGSCTFVALSGVLEVDISLKQLFQRSK